MARPTQYDEVKVYEAIHQFKIIYGRGPTNSDIVKETGLDRRLVSKYIGILVDSGLVERDGHNRHVYHIKGGFKTIHVRRNGEAPAALKDGRKRRALRDRMTYQQRVAAARKGLSRRGDKRRAEAERIEEAVKMGKAKDASLIWSDQPRGEKIRAWKIG